MTDHCRHSAENQPCPISNAPCPGFCVYADILENIDIGIIVINYVSRSMVFQNTTAKSFFRHAADPGDYHYLCSLLLPGLKDGIVPEQKKYQNSIHYFDRILGYTVYNICADYIWIFISDVTDKNRLESIAEAVNTMDNIGYVFSGIRHEIGNPINSIKMALTVLKNNLDRYSKETVAEYLDRTLAEILRVEYLLKSLKNFSLFEKPDLQQVDMRTFLANLTTLVRDDFDRKGIKIILEDFLGDIWARVDPRMLQQVMLNLLINSADALDDETEGTPIIAINVSIGGGLVWLRIEDNGCGISEERLSELFKPFYTSKPHGTGLGLVISRKMLAKMNGTIEIKSREKQGTAVTISIPEGIRNA